MPNSVELLVGARHITALCAFKNHPESYLSDRGFNTNSVTVATIHPFKSSGRRKSLSFALGLSSRNVRS